MERAPGRPSAQTSTLKPSGTLSLSTGSCFADFPVTSIAKGCRGDFSCSALRPCCQDGGAAGAAGACACAAAAVSAHTSADVREMCDRNGAGDMEYPPFPGCRCLRGGAAVQPAGGNGLIATLAPGRNRGISEPRCHPRGGSISGQLPGTRGRSMQYAQGPKLAMRTIPITATTFSIGGCGGQ